MVLGTREKKSKQMWVPLFLLFGLAAYINSPVQTQQITAAYFPSNLVTPVVSGTPLHFMTLLAELWPFKPLFFRHVYKTSDFDIVSAFAHTLQVAPTFSGLVHPTSKGTPLETDWTTVPKKSEYPGFQFQTVVDFAQAYRSGKTNPVQVAQKLIANIKSAQETHKMATFVAYNIDDINRQAQESQKRFHLKAPLSVLDGVPVAIKDELDVIGFKTYGGTKFIGDVHGVKNTDASVVANLRKLGAIIVGKTNMYEVGAGTTGANYHWGMPRNAYNHSHYTGGSSAGSGSVVGSGITPIAIGADGGGSVRIPSAFNGIVGLKPTFGRCSEHGAFPICWSIAHVGPMGATVVDTALLYLAMQGPDPHDAISQVQPHNDFKMTDIKPKIKKGLKIGVFNDWNNDASPASKKAFDTMIEQLKSEGAQIVPIEIPYLVAMMKAHTITIGSEMRTSLEPYLRVNSSLFSLEVRASMAFFSSIKVTDYVDAAKIRTFALSVAEKIFKEVDVIATPATAIESPRIPLESLDSGYSDVTALGNIMKFMQFGNLVGVPGIVLPISYTENNLPLSIQFMAKHWNEKLLFEVAGAVERLVTHKNPQVHFSYEL